MLVKDDYNMSANRIKLLVYGSKQIMDEASYHGQAEADLILYRVKDGYKIKRSKLKSYFGRDIFPVNMVQSLDCIQRNIAYVETKMDIAQMVERQTR